MKKVITECTCDVCGSIIDDDDVRSSGRLAADFIINATEFRFEDICCGCQVILEDVFKHIAAERRRGTPAAQLRIALNAAFKVR